MATTTPQEFAASSRSRSSQRDRMAGPLGMTLLYVLFAKVVPIISIWELKAGQHPAPGLRPPATEEHPLGEMYP